MKHNLYRWIACLLVLATILIFMSGCVTTVVATPPPGVVIVAPGAPPLPPPPGAWVPGQYEWDGRAWIWVPGHWR